MALKVKSIKPMYTQVLTTTNRYENDSTVTGSILIDSKKTKGTIKEYQTVLKVGSAVRECKPGDVVYINPAKYTKRKYDENSLRNDFVENPILDVNIPTIEVDGEDCFLINESDIALIVDDWDEVPDEPKATMKIITPKTPTIIA